MKTLSTLFLVLVAIVLFLACGDPIYEIGGRCVNTCIPYGINAQPAGSICVDHQCQCPSGTSPCCGVGNPGRCQVEACAPEDQCPNEHVGLVVACIEDAPCPKPVSPLCGRGVCIDKACEFELTPELLPQRYGDCKSLSCHSSGAIIELDDSSDYFDDARPCTVDFCKDGPVNLPLSDGSPCSDPAPGYCYQGQCVQCVDIMTSAACPMGEVCDDFWCELPGPCSGGACGGPCAPCDAGLSCANHSDCLSNSCVGAVCLAPSCKDGRLNGGESDLDCGGPACEPCLDGKVCHAHADCISQVCVKGTCRVPTCTDGVQNGTEEGNDCGSTCAIPCP